MVQAQEEGLWESSHVYAIFVSWIKHICLLHSLAVLLNSFWFLNTEETEAAKNFVYHLHRARKFLFPIWEQLSPAFWNSAKIFYIKLNLTTIQKWQIFS